METIIIDSTSGVTVYQELLQACLSYQTGTVNIRRILSPCFAEETAEAETRQFYTEYDAAEAYERMRIDAGVENAGLYLPERLDPVVAPEPDPNAPIFVPEATAPTFVPE